MSTKACTCKSDFLEYLTSTASLMSPYQCPLEHHDIASLERLRLARTRGEREEPRAATSAFDLPDVDSAPFFPEVSISERRAENVLAALQLQQQILLGTQDGVDGATRRLQSEPTTSEETTGCNLCKTFYAFWFLIIASSLAVGFWRSVVTSDEGKGFTDAAYMVAVGGIILYPVQDRHARRCRTANGVNN